MTVSTVTKRRKVVVLFSLIFCFVRLCVKICVLFISEFIRYQEIIKNRIMDREYLIIDVWMNIVNVVRIICDMLDENVRRWWVRPHLAEDQRIAFGAYSTDFVYMINHDHEKLYDFIGMSFEQFNYLHRLVQDRLTKNSRRTPLPTELRLAATLYFLRHGGSVQMCALAFRIGTSTMYAILPEVCRALNDVLKPICIPLPNANEWKVIANGFRDRWNLPNCLGAVDGKHFAIETPPNSGSFFFNYKKFSSIVLMAACDSYLRFTWTNVGDYGSLNDAGIFKNSDLGKALHNETVALPPAERLPGSNITCPYYFIGDGGFGLKKYFLTPFTRINNLSIAQRIYNYRLSRARRTIESAFGVLVSKWKILKDTLGWKLGNTDIIISACICLHNFIITCKIQDGDEVDQCDEPDNQADRNEVQDDVNNIVDQDLSGIQLRETIMNYVMSPEGSVPWQWSKL